jgi:hypothetical protein
MQLIFKFIIAILAIVGIAALAFFGLVMKDDAAQSTNQLIDASRQLLQSDKKEQSSAAATVTPTRPVITDEVSVPAITRPMATLNIPSKTQADIQIPPSITSGNQQAQSAMVPTQQSIDDRRVKLQKLNKIQADLQAAMAQDPANMDMESVDNALSELASLGDANGVVGGVNIEELRQTMRAAGEMTVLSKKIEEYSSNPNGADPAKMMEYVEQLQKLQSKLVVPTISSAVQTATP